MDTPILLRNGMEFAQGDDDVEVFMEGIWQRGKIMQIDAENKRMQIWVSIWYPWFDLDSKDVRKIGESDALTITKNGNAGSTATTSDSRVSLTRTRSSKSPIGSKLASSISKSILSNHGDAASRISRDFEGRDGPATRAAKRRRASATVSKSQSETVIIDDDVKLKGADVNKNVGRLKVSDSVISLGTQPAAEVTSDLSGPKNRLRRTRTERIVFANFKLESYYYPGLIRINRDDLVMYKNFRITEYSASQNGEDNAKSTSTATGEHQEVAVGVASSVRKSKKTVDNTNFEVYYFDNAAEFLPLKCIIILNDKQPFPVGTEVQVQTGGIFVPDTMRNRNMLRCTQYGTYYEAQIEGVSSVIKRKEGAGKNAAKSASRETRYRVRFGRGLVEEDVPVWRMRFSAKQAAALCAAVTPSQLDDSDFEEVDVNINNSESFPSDAQSVITISSDATVSSSVRPNRKRKLPPGDANSDDDDDDDADFESDCKIEVDSTSQHASGVRRSSRISTQIATRASANMHVDHARTRRMSSCTKLADASAVTNASIDKLIDDAEDMTVVELERDTSVKHRKDASPSSDDLFTMRRLPSPATKVTTTKAKTPKDCKPMLKAKSKQSEVKVKKAAAPKNKRTKRTSDSVDNILRSINFNQSFSDARTATPAAVINAEPVTEGPLNNGIFDGRSFVLLRATMSLGAQQSVSAIDVDQMALNLRRNGGSIRSGFIESPVEDPGLWIPNVPRECYLLAVQHSRIPLYLEAVALGVPCVSYTWVDDCIGASRLLDYRGYMLQTGINLLTESVIVREPRATPVFSNRRFYVVGFTPTFCTKWWPVIVAAAGDYIRAPALPPTLTAQQLVAAAKDSSSKLIEEVKATLIASCGTISSLIQARQISFDYVLLQTKEECRMENTVLYNLFVDAIRIVNNQLRLSAPNKLVTTDFISQSILQGRLLEPSSYGKFIPL